MALRHLAWPREVQMPTVRGLANDLWDTFVDRTRPSLQAVLLLVILLALLAWLFRLA